MTAEAEVTIAEMTVAELLAAIATPAPSPGAGAAGAVALALGLACARKAVRISATHHPDDDAFAAADGVLERGVAAALAGGQDDATAFRGLIAAMRLPHAEAAAATRRAEQVAAAGEALAGIGGRLVALADESAATLQAVAGRIDAIVANDAASARALMAAARMIHVANLSENHMRS